MILRYGPDIVISDSNTFIPFINIESITPPTESEEATIAALKQDPYIDIVTISGQRHRTTMSILSNKLDRYCSNSYPSSDRLSNIDLRNALLVKWLECIKLKR